MIAAPRCLESKRIFQVRDPPPKKRMMQYKEGKTHLVFLAFVSLDVINIEMINIRLSGSSEFKVFCNIVCIFQKLYPNFVLKNSLFFLCHRTV